MNGYTGPDEPFRERGRSWRGIVLVMAMAVTAIALNDEIHSPTVPAEVSPATTQFVLLFRQGPAPLSEADQSARADAIVAWAKRQNDAGHRLDPRKLGDELQWIGAQQLPGEARPGRPDQAGNARTAADVGALANILFLEARDFAEAVEIARSHPGLRYGSSVEVRPWTSPAPAAGR